MSCSSAVMEEGVAGRVVCAWRPPRQQRPRVTCCRGLVGDGGEFVFLVTLALFSKSSCIFMVGLLCRPLRLIKPIPASMFTRPNVSLLHFLIQLLFGFNISFAGHFPAIFSQFYILL